MQKLLEVLDPNDVEYELYRTIEDMKEESEILTNSAKGNKKSYLEVENTALANIQSEREIQRAKEARRKIKS